MAFINGLIVEINPQGCIWMGDTWLIDILSILTFLVLNI